MSRPFYSDAKKGQKCVVLLLLLEKGIDIRIGVANLSQVDLMTSKKQKTAN